MADELRSCRRTGCRWPAAASLSYRYASRQVWLLDLAEERHPSLYDLCPHHADHLTLPRGWQLVDQRTSPPAVVEPAARDRVPEAIPAHLREAAAARGHPRHLPESAPTPMSRAASGESSAPGRAGSRYATLVEDLPRLAASLADHPDLQTHEAGWPAPQPQRATESTPAPQAGSSPVPRAGPVRVAQAGSGVEHGEIAGQLVIPVDDLPPLGESGKAVVVSIQRAGGRRRDPHHHHARRTDR